MSLISLWMASALARPLPELPVPLAARSPTLPEAAVRLDADSTVGLSGAEPAAVDFAAGFGVGVTDRFEIGAQVLPIDIAPEVLYTAPSVYGAYAAPLGDFASLTPDLRLFLPVGAGSQTMLDASVTLAIRAGRRLQLTVRPVTNLAFEPGATRSAFAVPVGLIVQADPRVFFLLDSALSTDPMDARFRAPRSGTVDPAVFVPLGAAAGVTLGRPRTGVSDLSLGVWFPELGQFSAAATTSHTEDFTVIARFQASIPTGSASPRVGRR